MITFDVMGVPIAKARPKFARRGKFVSTYNPQESEEGMWLTKAMAAMPKAPITGPITLMCEFYFPIPQSWSKKKQKAAASGELYHTKKPDLDNLVKFVKDCLNGVAWLDDAQVMAIFATKHYTKQHIQYAPMTSVVIRPEPGL